MKFSYTFVVLLIIQLALKYVKAELGSKDMLCEGGTVVQYGSSYECKCESGYVPATPNKCVKSDTLINPCTPESSNVVCAANAKCLPDSSKPGSLTCTCNPGYIPAEPEGNGCVLTKCKDLKCGKGVCAVDGNTAICSCHINHKNSKENDKTSECVDGGEHKCDLKCVDNAQCQLHADGYFFCECKNKKPMVDGACSNAITAFLSPFHVLFIIGIYIIYLKSA